MNLKNSCEKLSAYHCWKFVMAGVGRIYLGEGLYTSITGIHHAKINLHVVQLRMEKDCYCEARLV